MPIAHATTPVSTTTSRNRSERNTLMAASGGVAEAVADAAHGEDVDGLARIRLDLLAQVPDVYVDGARLAVGRVAPDRLEQRLAGVDPAGVERERVQNLELDVGELHRRAVHGHRA